VTDETGRRRGPAAPCPCEVHVVDRFLLETYVPQVRAVEAREAGLRAHAAAEELAREGTRIRYVRTTFLPEDETCFHLFDAQSAEAVREVGRRAGLEPIRVVGALE
jgi:uncharacterized protein DUF4242